MTNHRDEKVAAPAKTKQGTRRQFLQSAAAVGSTAGLAGLVAACAVPPGTLAGAPVAAPQAQASATGKLDAVLKRGKLIAGVTLTIPPFGFKDQGGTPVGFDIDMAHILAKGLFNDPTKVDFFEQEMDARIPNLVTGKTDIAIQLITVTAQRAQTVEFTIPYFREGNKLLLPVNSPYKGYQDMVGKKVKVSILQNVFANDTVKMVLPDAEIQQLDTVANAILAVQGGRVDAYVGGGGETSYAAAQNPTLYKVSNDGWEPQTYAAAVSPGDQRWLNFVNQVFHEALIGLDFPAYQASYRKWFGTDIPLPTVGFPDEFAARPAF